VNPATLSVRKGGRWPPGFPPSRRSFFLLSFFLDVFRCLHVLLTLCGSVKESYKLCRAGQAVSKQTVSRQDEREEEEGKTQLCKGKLRVGWVKSDSVKAGQGMKGKRKQACVLRQRMVQAYLHRASGVIRRGGVAVAAPEPAREPVACAAGQHSTAPVRCAC